MAQTLRGQWILSAYINKTLLSANSQCGNRHAFQDCKRVAFHQNAVFERAWLGLVGIADDIMGAAGASLEQKSFPFFPRGESRTSSAQKARVDHFADNFFWTHLDGTAQRFE